jgi:hypothetical protein
MVHGEVIQLFSKRESYQPRTSWQQDELNIGKVPVIRKIELKFTNVHTGRGFAHGFIINMCTITKDIVKATNEM